MNTWISNITSRLSVDGDALTPFRPGVDGDTLSDEAVVSDVLLGWAMGLVGLVGTLMHAAGRLEMAAALAAVLAAWLVAMCLLRLHKLRDENGRSVDLMSWPHALWVACGSMTKGVLFGLVLLQAGL